MFITKIIEIRIIVRAKKAMKLNWYSLLRKLIVIVPSASLMKVKTKATARAIMKKIVVFKKTQITDFSDLLF